MKIDNPIIKIISFDVGIKNLAFCYSLIKTDETKENKLIEILQWNIINLLEDKICYYDKCKKKPTYHGLHMNYTIYMCDKHKFTIKNIKRYIPPTCKTIKIEILKLELIKQLDKIFLPILFNNIIDHVIIENQPSYKNPKMKAISDTLYTWFLIRGIHDLNKIIYLKYIPPINKNKIFNKKFTKYNYNENKANSVIITKDYLNDISLVWKEYLIKSKKKDDLADCFLQMIHYIKY